MKGKGLTYERKFGRYLRRLGLEPVSGQWITFCDARGGGAAQPDHFIVLPDVVVLFECKLSQRDEAFDQLNLLYRPLLSAIYSRPIIAVQVCKILRWRTRLINDPVRICTLRRDDSFTMHWLG